ncbi:major facilitator superfamily domain-containing protein SP1173 [Haematobia irritans]|uniref:major facilitator superfamily domain-containing protein SP1173 n=1 Tax=Haematobia irritans TaxID=7368 RepID=UPI003F50BA69
MGATKPRVNRTLISLKAVTFFVLSGLTALHIVNSQKPINLGLYFSEYREITIIAAFVSILGPLIVGPLADRVAAKNHNGFGKTLRILTAICLIITSVIYACLVAVPLVSREEDHLPKVSFACGANGAAMFQQSCGSESRCNHWDKKVGNLELTNCTYSCLNPNQFENMYTPWLESIPTPSPSTEQSSEFDYDDDAISAVTESLRSRRSAEMAQQQIHSSEMAGGGEVMSAEVAGRQTRAVKSARSKIYVEPPHICMTGKDEHGATVIKNCHVYTDDTLTISVHTIMRGATNVENDTHSAEWCHYPLEGFQCHIPQQQVNYMLEMKNGTECNPMIECHLQDPYHTKGSLMAHTECVKTEGDIDVTYGGYITIRILGDIFALASFTLLNTAIVIAVRETSEGRGEVCRQYAWGALGYVVLFSPLKLIFADGAGVDVVLIVMIICFLIGSIVLLCATQMPLSPPEWWWHTKTGMLVYPMSAIRKYSPEIFVLTLVAILFGTFWGSIHSYLLWSFIGDYAVYFASLLLVLVLFLNVDKFIEYCGHSNIFIGGFAMYIIRFTAYASVDTKWLTNIMEIFEPVIISVVWITIILYMRHAMPRKLTATGQAIAVLSFFGLGKGFGALISLVHEDESSFFSEEDCTKFEWLAVVACIVALTYFVIYNLILAPRCAAKPVHLDDLMSGSASQTFANGAGGGTASTGGGTLTGQGNGNGSSYSPLRVYHNERGKKGQFRY